MKGSLRSSAWRFAIAVNIALGLVCSVAHAQQDVPVVEGGSEADLEARMQKLEQSLQGRGLLDLANQVEALQQEVKELRGEVEQQQHLIEQLQQAKTPVPVAAAPSADPRWSASPAPAASAAANVAPGAAAPAVPTPTQSTQPTQGAVATVPQVPPVANAAPAAAPPAPTDINADPEQAYAAAFNALKAGNYEEAIAQFNNFLVTHPDSDKADSAQYWLGEAYYVNKQYEAAINEYQKLLAAYPKSQKVSQAMLKIGFCQQELGQADKAKATLQEVLQRYPGTTSARMAEDRLQRMRLEQPNAKL